MTTALYRRYRPDSFAHVIGQEHVTDPLRAALRANKVTHAYLFSGPRGCGKTTSARILARCLNCAQGPTDSPCGECDSCRELATGGSGSLDVVEIDAASHGGVDDARELRERATFAPVRDRYKVFIIDEAHMVTPQGFNALLKLVEEPPEHVKFVFATTEPDRVLGTIRSRTHHYPFRLVPPDALEPYLAQLSHEEGIEVAPGVLSLVIRAGGGSVRDTLSVLDQLMAGTIDGTLGYHQAVALLGYTDSALLDETVDALAGGDGAAVYRVVERMVESGHDPRRFVEDLLQRLRDLLIISVAGDGAADVLTGTPADQLERMVTQARNWGPRHLSRAADLTDQALRAMVGATSPRLQLELLIGRILVPATIGQSGADPALPGTVGMVGGGAPHEADARASSAQSESVPMGGAQAGSEGRRFGAAQAREELRRKRQGETAASAPAHAPASPAEGRLSSPSAPAMPASTTPPSAAERPQGSMPATQTPAFTDSAPNEPASSRRAPASSGWADVTAAVPGSGMGASASLPTQEPGGESGPVSARIDAAPSIPEAAPAQEARNPQTGPASVSPAESTLTSRDSDMLRQRWPEVIERLSSISRVAWSLLHANGQLGGVDGTTAVVVLPTEGLVENFMRGNRGVDVERAIHEATGLTLNVIAQVGQASGGAQVTTPTAAAAPAREPSNPQREEDSASADPFRVDPTHAYSSAPGVGPEQPAMAENVVAEEGTPEAEERSFSSSSAVYEDTPVDSAWPEAVVPPGSHEVNEPFTSVKEDARESIAPAPSGAASSGAASSGPASFAADPFVPAPAQALAPWSEPVATIPNGEAPAQDYSPAMGTQTGASSVFGDEVYGDQATGKNSANGGKAQSAGFTRPHLTQIEGGAGALASHADTTDMGTVHTTSPNTTSPNTTSLDTARADMATTTDTAGSSSTGVFGAHPAASGARVPDTASASSFHDTPSLKPVTAPSRPQVCAAEDDSASIDDIDVENSQSYGLPAVFEILGGKVIEEKTTEGGW